MPAFPPTSEGGLETQDGHQSGFQYLRNSISMEWTAIHLNYYCVEHLADQPSAQVGFSEHRGSRLAMPHFNVKFSQRNRDENIGVNLPHWT